jgi:hypothetical protein
MMEVREGKPINFNKYGKKDCRKSICWTNRTRKAINEKWNIKESKDVKYVTLKNMRVYIKICLLSVKKQLLLMNRPSEITKNSK